MSNDYPDSGNLSGESGQEVELTDGDILDAMQHVPGYIDITTADFRIIYHLAHRHAVKRHFASITAGRLMRNVAQALQPDQTLDIAARVMAGSGFKSLPVVDAASRVVGVLTETDFLARLKAGSFLELLLRLLQDPGEFTHRCHETRVAEVMSQPAITVEAGAGFSDIMQAFSQHSGRSMPVVDGQNKLLGLLLRKDFLHQVGARLL